MKAILILSVIVFLQFVGLIWCITSIHNLCGAIKSILETVRVYDQILGLKE